jgi:gliding motility-associated-like protein
VELVATSIYGCTDTVESQVTVNHTAVAGTNLNTQSGCTPLTVQLANLNANYDALFWDFGDGNTSVSQQANLTHTFINSTPQPVGYAVTVIASTINGCNDTTTIPVTVNPDVVADFQFDSTGCSPLNVQFLNNSTGASVYNWNLGGGSTSSLTNPTNVFSTQGQNATYTISLEATSLYGCSDTLVKNVTVYPTAVASMGVNTTTACTPATIQFTNSSFDYNTLLWDFDNGGTSGTTQPNFSQVFTNTTGTPNFHEVTLYANTSYGCNDTAVVTLEIYPEVEAVANFDTAGCSPFYVQFQNSSSGGSTYSWNLGNGTVSPQMAPDQTYTNNTNSVVSYPITLTTTSAYGCTDITGGNIYVHPQPVAQFLANPIQQTFPLTVVTFQNTTTQNGLNYLWDFDNGTTSNAFQPGAVDFVNIGDYNVSLIASNPHCSDTITQLVQIIPPPPVAGYTGGGSGCAPLTVQFTNISDYGQEYLWDFGDGNYSSVKNPSYTFFQPGVYSVTLTVTNGTGTDTYVISNGVTVHPNAVANFDYNPYSVSTSGSQTFFYNQSANATIFEWNFGDGSSSTEENPVYQYTSVGDYPITLIANNQYNCPDTVTHPTYIRVEANGQVTFPNAFIPNPNGPSGGRYSPNTLDNTVFHPITVGVEKYHLVIYNRWGELVFETFDTQIGWDGYYRNELSPQDVYVWKAKVTLVNGEDKIYTGDVTLLR